MPRRLPRWAGGWIERNAHEHTMGFARIADRDPHTLAFSLGALGSAWGSWVSFFPNAWDGTRIYAPLVYWAPGWAVGLPMLAAGVVQLVASTNGVMLGRLAMWAIVLQACIWGTVSWTAWVVLPSSTGTGVYTVLSLLSLLLFWQWRTAARRGGRLPLRETHPRAG